MIKRLKCYKLKTGIGEAKGLEEQEEEEKNKFTATLSFSGSRFLILICASINPEFTNAKQSRRVIKRGKLSSNDLQRTDVGAI